MDFIYTHGCSFLNVRVFLFMKHTDFKLYGCYSLISVNLRNPCAFSFVDRLKRVIFARETVKIEDESKLEYI